MFVEKFAKQKIHLEKIIKYVHANFYLDKRYSSFNRLDYIIFPKQYQKGTIFSDTFISKELEKTSVRDISFEKSSKCLERFAFDLVRCTLKSDASLCQYYYVYNFCESDTMSVDKPTFKSINLDKQWSLEIEK